MRTTQRTAASALIAAVFVATLVLTLAAKAEGFEPPKDGALTEKQFVSYLAVMKESFAYLRELGQKVDQGQSSVASAAALLGSDERLVAIRKKHGLGDEAELSWVGERVTEAWGAATADQALDGAANPMAALAEQLKQAEQTVAGAQSRLAAHQASLKSGRRVLTAEERQSIVDAARQGEVAALEDAKARADEAAAAAKDDPAAAAEARRQAADARTRAAAAAARAKAPDAPQTDEERAEVRAANEQAVETLTQELANGRETIAAMKSGAAEMKKAFDEMHKGIPPKNVELVKKHLQALQAAFGMESK